VEVTVVRRLWRICCVADEFAFCVKNALGLHERSHGLEVKPIVIGIFFLESAAALLPRKNAEFVSEIAECCVDRGMPKLKVGGYGAVAVVGLAKIVGGLCEEQQHQLCGIVPGCYLDFES
jgi:hypothetical protein